jgi:hypothetical protein
MLYVLPVARRGRKDLQNLSYKANLLRDVRRLYHHLQYVFPYLLCPLLIGYSPPRCPSLLYGPTPTHYLLLCSNLVREPLPQSAMQALSLIISGG